MGNVAAAAQKGHFKAAGDDQAGLRDVRDGRKVGIQVMSHLSVRHGAAASSVRIQSHILVRTVRKVCMRPSFLVVCSNLLVQIFCISICRIKAEGCAYRSDFRELDDQLGTRPCDIGSIVLHGRLRECLIRHLDIHRSPIFLLSAADIKHSGLLVHYDLRI